MAQLQQMRDAGLILPGFAGEMAQNVPKIVFCALEAALFEAAVINSEAANPRLSCETVYNRLNFIT
ncbi:hypothetical protein [Hoeflea olei]|uniref:hypothetical protein n=1 Tax=Hoeflea olei TaxID=1480615 RepID=UPI001AECEA59|nr:hypothetical protein [Hoeflea olei]